MPLTLSRTLYLDGAMDLTAIAAHDANADRYIDDRGNSSAPIFDGSYDWHSSVHAHLANILAYEVSDDARGMQSFVSSRFSAADVQAEIALNFYDPYGWAWLLQLDMRMQENGHNEMEPAAIHFASELIDTIEAQLASGRGAVGLGSHGDINWQLASLGAWAQDRGDTGLAAGVRELFLEAQEQSSITANTNIATGDFYSQVAISAYGHIMNDATDTASYRTVHDTMLDAVTNGELERLITQSEAALDSGVGFGHFAGRVISTGFGYWALFQETLNPAFHAAYDAVIDFTERYAAELGDGIGPGHWLPNFAAFAAGLPGQLVVEDPTGSIADSITEWTKVNGIGLNEIDGSGGADRLIGTSGDDILDGGRGKDTLDGRDGDDVLVAGFDDGTGDVFIGGRGTDTYKIADSEVARYAFDINLATGRDTYNNSYSGIENVIGGGGNDRFTGDRGANRLEGREGNDILDGGRGKDALYGGAGDDVILAGFDDGTGDVFDGGTGTDTYQIAGTEVERFAFDIDLATGRDRYNNSYSEIENIIGGTGNDRLLGDDMSNILNALSGNDTVDGRGGDDILHDGDGSDLYFGGAGQDTIIFRGAASDYSMSRSGDFLVLNSASGQDRVHNSVEEVYFSSQTLASSHIASGSEHDRFADLVRQQTGDDYFV